MKRNIKMLFFVFYILLLSTNNVNATSGKLKTNSIIISSPPPQSGTIKEPEVKEYVKNSDMSLKSIVIDNNNIDISENMTFTTSNESVEMSITPSNGLNSVDFSSLKSLELGDNMHFTSKTESISIKSVYYNAFLFMILM